MKTRALLLVACSALSFASWTAVAERASAQGPDAGITDAGVPSDGGAPSSVTGCVESVPKGAERPAIAETFPQRGTSGWAATLAITVQHGKGERVLPSGLDLSSAVDAKKYLKQAGFAIPDQDGGAAARLWTEPDDPAKSRATTHLDLPLVTLPEGPGRNIMHLPPLPVAVARANGEIATVCTHPHTIVVEDPTANVPTAEPKGNPPPRPQREEWTSLKKALLWGGAGLLAGALLAYAAYRFFTRPKPPPPPVPPRPPWEIALEKLDEVRHAGLLETGRHTEYFDRVSDAVRGYLGARFGFDGLESTTDEILVALRKQGGGFVRLESGAELDLLPGPAIPLNEIAGFLAECDLVKFANLMPSPSQCAAALDAGEHIVRTTSPLRAFGSGIAKEPAPASEAVPEKSDDGGAS
ncbi:hypothetical protein AKJ09_10537 [Labilithrix luteola]|uniref:Uncharacterized protein n=1 Tax=Labilithrix luteola TaxID=1391654 RepID=A0A0K1QDN5_9BACT|nr:hypothetical protein [Labilithrix luteola]AKV03874.1 hypothetical protein AKJ09_10537 [Labilithrix luteola]